MLNQGTQSQGILSTRTRVARVVSHSQRVPVIIGVHGEEAHSKGTVLGVRGAIFKVLQVDTQLVAPLDGQGVDLLQPCRRRQTQTTVTKTPLTFTGTIQSFFFLNHYISTVHFPLRGCYVSSSIFSRLFVFVRDSFGGRLFYCKKRLLLP